MEYHATAAIGCLALRPFTCDGCGRSEDAPGWKYLFCFECHRLYVWRRVQWVLTDGELEENAQVLFLGTPDGA